MKELSANKFRDTRIHIRGNFLEPGDAVEPSLPAAFLSGFDNEGGVMNRLTLAKWLLSEANPLTARVMVNRVWARFYGTGIVETEEDFGTQGSRPTHPKLLDWLAVSFRTDHGWSLKALCREIVLSSTYRQSVRVSASDQSPDPENRWLARSTRVRLSAEAIRDQALFAAGLLSSTVGGPSVMPPQPDGIWRTTYSTLKWDTPAGEDRYRRGPYTFLRRTSPYPSLITFDGGSGEICQIRRIRTNTPLQALITMNDPVYVEAAGHLALRAQQSQNALKEIFRRILIRHPTPHEKDRLEQLQSDARNEFRTSDESAAKLLSACGLDIPESLDQQIELASLTVVASVILNLDETIMSP